MKLYIYSNNSPHAADSILNIIRTSKTYAPASGKLGLPFYWAFAKVCLDLAMAERKVVRLDARENDRILQ